MPIALTIIELLWKGKWLILGLVAGLMIWHYADKMKNYAVDLMQSKANFEQAQQANATNQKTIKALQDDIEAEKQAIKQEQDRSDKLAKELEQIRKDMENVPGANDPLPPYLSRLLDELQQRQRATSGG